MPIRHLQHCFAKSGMGLQKIAGNRAGFSLFELLVAVSLIALSCILLFGVQADNVDRAGEARFYGQSAMLAQQKLTDLNLQDFASLADASGDFGPGYPGMHLSLRVRALSAEESGLAGSSGWLKLVELTLRDSASSHYAYSVRTLLMRKIEASQ